MRFLALFMGVLLTFQLSFCPIALAAVQVNATNDGGVQAQVPVNKIGALLLADGLAIMSGTTIAITAKGPDGTPQSQLQGNLFKVTQVGNTISGYAFFNAGQGLGGFSDCGEQVDLLDGTKIKGAIENITSQQVTVNGRNIAMEAVSKVHSGRVYQFKVINDKVSKANFQSTCTKIAAGNKPKMSKGMKITLLVLAAAGIAAAIAIPIAVSSGGGGGGGGNNNPPPGNPGTGNPPPSGGNPAGGFNPFPPRGGRDPLPPPNPRPTPDSNL